MTILYETLLESMKEEFPGLTISDKSKGLWKYLPGKRYTTVLGNYIVLHKPANEQYKTDLFVTLLHERAHLRQFKKLGFGNIWFGFSIFMVLYTLIPFPTVFAYYRTKFEKEAYKETIRAVVLTRGAFKHKYSSSYVNLKFFIVNKFTTASYFYMWPFRKHMKKWFEKTYEEVLREEGLHETAN